MKRNPGLAAHKWSIDSIAELLQFTKAERICLAKNRLAIVNSKGQSAQTVFDRISILPGPGTFPA